jgi:hypothetical protein
MLRMVRRYRRTILSLHKGGLAVRVFYLECFVLYMLTALNTALYVVFFPREARFFFDIFMATLLGMLRHFLFW